MCGVCDAICDGVYWSLMGIKGPNWSCFPPCLKNSCACGFNDDDPRFAAISAQNKPPPPTSPLDSNQTSTQTQPQPQTNSMIIPKKDEDVLVD